VALLAARLGRHPVALPMELTGAAAGLVAAVLAAGDRPTLALVLALGGVITAGTAVRAERRPAAGHLAAVLFVLATWVRLYASDVTTPEAYTLPVTLPALAVGVLRRRRDPGASSWTAYGPGLAATLLPSLVAAWGDDHWLRPLLLGLAALALTLTGARLRLQALLVLGGTVLALDALHELAPYVVQVVGALPRWLPPALAGLLLLAVGATYEQRLRDARRLRDTLGRMR
ncbi:SCO7613 C-terminal domain-containing membrane protein, partial [Streptomyces sp.]|uniref:SCO7613 C-terminal domain-containing membrane protein n=1 Tax=Streptomyces sp. TaxID=1931 RepID=UPI002D7852D0